MKGFYSKLMAIILVFSFAMSTYAFAAEEGTDTGSSETGASSATEGGDADPGKKEEDTETGKTDEGTGSEGDKTDEGTGSDGDKTDEGTGSDDDKTDEGTGSEGDKTDEGTDSEPEETEKKAEEIKYTGAVGEQIAFSLRDFSVPYETITEKDFSLIEITKLPSSTYGTLYYAYGSSDEEAIAKGDRFSDEEIGSISFVGKKEGSVTVGYRMTGTGDDVTGSVKITVTEKASKADVISYTTTSDEAVRFKSADFDEVCEDATDDTLDYVKFTLPASSKGTLYFDYEGSNEAKVTASKKYYRSGTQSVNKVYFVPKSSASGTVTISYVAMNESGDELEGTVRVKITASDDDDDDDVPVIKYTAKDGDEVDFDVDDFEDACSDAVDEDLIRIVFSSLPSSSKGTLYLDYVSASDYEEKVDKTESYYVDDDPYIDDITFVPKKSASGKITLSYKGYYSKSKYYTGKIQITLSGDDDDDDDDDDSLSTLTLSTSKNEEVSINASSISTAFKKATKKTLSYIKFSSLSSSYGKLYYDYDGDDEEAVKTTQKYYSGKAPYIKNVSFVPAKNYTGTFTLNYTAYATSGSGASGKIKITVKSTTGSASSSKSEDTTISLGTFKNKNVTLTISPFNIVSLSVTDESVAAVRMGMVNASFGKLYYNYGKSGQYEITGSKIFYTNREPYITGVTFVPEKGYKGEVSIGYTGTNEDGDSFTGTIKLTVSSYKKSFTDVSEDKWYYDTVNTVCDADLMKGNSETTFNPEGNMTVAEAITMGARLYNMIKGGKDTDFNAASGESWYDVYVNYALANGIIKEGDFDDYNRSATRAEMAYIFCHSVTSSYLSVINSWVVPDVLKTDKYGTEIYTLYNAGILNGGDEKGSFFAANNVTRAEAATILGRAGRILDRVKK